MKIGYVRVSTMEQNYDLQLDALEKAGCEKFFTDKISGAKSDRPGLNEALNFLRAGDCLVIWRLDRLGRSLKHLIEVAEGLAAREVGLVSLQDDFNTTTSGGKLVFHFFGALAEFERNLIRERTMAGLAAARSRGRKGGRNKALDATKTAMLKSLHKSKSHSVKDICKQLEISRPTFYRYLNEGEASIAV